MLVSLLLLVPEIPMVGATLPPGFAEERINGPTSANWTQAVGIYFEPNGRMYVLERAGRVWFQEYGTTTWNLLVDIREEVGSWDDHGCLGFALDPNFRVNGNIYLMYVVDRHHLMNFGTAGYDPTLNDYRSATIGRITRYTARATDGFRSVDYASRRVLVGQTKTNGFPILYTSHGVGTLVFGADGTLLASCGDAASWQSTSADLGSAPETYYAQALADGIISPKENVGGFRAQLVDSLSGKILRIDPANGEGISSNPFFDPSRPDAARSKVWALGFRNPFRMGIRTDSGSHVRADANPGTLLIGDVGWGLREELDVCRLPGQNFGWPTFEGVGTEPQYSSYPVAAVPNLDAPNPLYPASGCSQYLTFNNLLRQNTSVATNKPPFNNPCSPGQKIPGSIPQFLHTPPVLDWAHLTTQARTWRFDGSGTAVPINVDAPGSPIASTTFGGNCAIGGVWYSGTDFPQQYRNSYFHGDLGGAWVKNIQLDANDNVIAVNNFMTGATQVVAMATHPIDGGLYYITYSTTVMKVTFPVTGNIPPKAVVSSDKTFGSGPLTVQFNGSGSTDPEGLPLAYDWDFADGTPRSSEINPVHVFNAPAGVPTRYNVTLTVTDSASQSSTATIIVSPNNSPPQVTITQPVNDSKYPMTGDSVYSLTANVVDAQSVDSQLHYEWRAYLHHNNHEHQEPTDTNHVGTAVISPAGCDGINIYYYRIELTVTDPQGLSTTTDVSIYPDCGFPDSPPSISSIPDQSILRNQSTSPLLFTVNDAETASAYLDVSVTSSNPVLVPPGGMTLGFSGVNRSLTVRPAAGQTGVGQITVTVDDGPNATSTSFLLRVTDPADPLTRTVWQIGTDDNPLVLPYRPTDEFSQENGKNDLPPGAVTRVPGDPQYVFSTNPGADDYYYFAGSYPSPFNGLTATLSVPNDEPMIAWERAHTLADRTNRLHFIFDPVRAPAGTRFRFSTELVNAGSTAGPGFSDHDMVIRFRNAAGATTLLFSKRVSQTTNIVLDFPVTAAGTVAGPNTLEIVRTGPAVPNVSYWIQYDYLRLETVPSANIPPILAPPANVAMDELSPLALNLTGSDADGPVQTLTYSLVNGPVGMSVSSGGALTWTPSEDQGPESFSVVVRVTDAGSPPMSGDATFTVNVREVNIAPVLGSIPDQIVNTLTPFSRTLTSTDPDIPAITPTYSLVNGPSGLTVSPVGVIAWTPTDAQGPGTYTVAVQVADNGVPNLTSSRQFTIQVNRGTPSTIRTLWEIGTDDNPTVLPYSPTSEFSIENGRNDIPPGLVTRLPGDPGYMAATNPRADDDFYFAGNYPVGFNGLGTSSNVPNDEPPSVWERALTGGDRTNRIHLVLDPTQVTPSSTFRFSFELVFSGSAVGGVVQSGFGDHDVVVRFRNGTGAQVDLFSQRISQSTNIILEFSAASAGALAGPNTIEIVRTGPNATGVSNWMQFDYLRLESRPGGDTVPVAVRRTAWQVGIIDNPQVLPYTPFAEFSLENGRNDPAPGQVTRLASDPQFAGASNPGADNDFYFAGLYSTPFNRLLSTLNVPNDEPSIAFERALTSTDRTNRVHLVLVPEQITAGSRIRLTIGFPAGGFTGGGPSQPTFGDHDVAIRFRNGADAAVGVYSQRISQKGTVNLEFLTSTVGATAGPNTVEIVRTGPIATGSTHWILFDYVLVEALPPAIGVSRKSADVARLGSSLVSLGASDYLTLTYDEPEASLSGVRYRIETSTDLINWSEADVSMVAIRSQAGIRSMTVRDNVALGATSTRFLRLRVVSEGDGAASSIPQGAPR